jgi:hypothetical protein
MSDETTPDTILLSPIAAGALSGIGLGDFFTVEQPDRMAWVVLVLKRLPDMSERFPRGKWATIQSIEQQLNSCADVTAKMITEGKPQ